MGVLKRLRASTLLETIIASLIFMCVFAISLETVSRLTTRSSDNAVLVEADYRIMECVREYGDGRHADGQYTREYEWGTIVVLLGPYREYADLQQLTVTADVKSLSKHLEFRHIIERDE
jgi:hypothetical protein